MSNNVGPEERRSVLLDSLRARRPEIKKEMAEQRKNLRRIKAIAKLASQLDVDMTAIGEMAESGVKAIDVLGEQMDRIFAETETPRKPELPSK
jgi:hypothetical protein